MPDGRVSVISFDRAIVNQLGLSDVAQAVQAETERAGLHPPSYFGTEAVARQLGLRFTQPHGREAIELFPRDQITRAEAAVVVRQGAALQRLPARPTTARCSCSTSCRR